MKNSRERLDARKKACVRVGIGCLEPPSDNLHLDARACDCCAVGKAADDEPIVAIAALEHVRCRYYRHPNLLLLRKGESLRHHADHGSWAAVDAHRAPNDCGIALVLTIPEGVAQDCNRRRAGRFVCRGEVAAEDRLLAHEVECACAHFRARERLGEPILVAVHLCHAVHERHAVERGGLGSPVRELGIADAAAAENAHVHELVVAFDKRESFKQDGVRDREHGGVHADAESQHPNCSDRIPWAATQTADRLASILNERLEPGDQSSFPWGGLGAVLPALQAVCHDLGRASN